EAKIVVAVLSRSYQTSRYGRMEWQAALRTDPNKLVTVRIEDCPLEGLLATITYVDLVNVATTAEARSALLSRLGHAVEGRAEAGPDRGQRRPDRVGQAARGRRGHVLPDRAPRPARPGAPPVGGGARRPRRLPARLPLLFRALRGQGRAAAAALLSEARALRE